ncbi:MAG: type III-B CRISPR-associated protein Cas10/Cmr2, partial [Candidatus Hodarchaeales archaeon]
MEPIIGTISFSITPVQDFIAQARKTSDYWSGSYLLSYLSGVAMSQIKNLGGEILIPNIDKDNLFNYIASRKSKPPKIGTLPNVFLAKVKDKQNATEMAMEAENAVREEWQRIATRIYDKFLSAVIETTKPKEIWNIQVQNFWRIQWIINDMTFRLPSLKNWNDYVYPSEDGDKCTMMGGWQEISGLRRSIYNEKEEQ